MQKLLILFFLLLPSLCIAQADVTGKVINHDDKKPVAGVTVFLNNATIGTITREDGTFTLPNLKSGQYDLVLTCIGYETLYQRLVINNAPVNLPVMEISIKSTILKEVEIRAPDPDHDRYLALFTSSFLGGSANAAECKLANPEVLDFNYERKKNTLNAESDEYLEVDNNALGYKVYYQVNKFMHDYTGHFQYYAGPARFEEMKGKPSQQKRWVKNRLETYQGSAMHFLRSVYEHRFAEEGFKVLRLIRKPNPARPADSLIRSKFRKFATTDPNNPEWRDSMSFWQEKYRIPKLLEYLVKQPLAEADFIKPAADDMLSIQFTDFLYIIYTKRKERIPDGRVYRTPDMPDNPTTILALNTKQALFDRNGVFIDPASNTLDGAWGISGVADMLPVNYVP